MISLETFDKMAETLSILRKFEGWHEPEGLQEECGTIWARWLGEDGKFVKIGVTGTNVKAMTLTPDLVGWRSRQPIDTRRDLCEVWASVYDLPDPQVVIADILTKAKFQYPIIIVKEYDPCDDEYMACPYVLFVPEDETGTQFNRKHGHKLKELKRVKYLYEYPLFSVLQGCDTEDSEALLNDKELDIFLHWSPEKGIGK